MRRRFVSSDAAQGKGSDPQSVSGPRWLLETSFLVVLAFALAQGTRAFAIQPFVVPTGSMVPTIELRNRLLVEKVTYRFVRPPRQGEIVVFDNPDPTVRKEKFFIKRVIATEGQIVDIRDGRVWVDGVALDEPYIHGAVTDLGDVSMPVTVPAGEVWLMGDNRPISGDSRGFGPQPISKIRGRAVWTYWPPKEFGELN